VRIIAGEKRGCQLAAPKGRDTRPTLDRVKESLFGILQFSIAGRRVLDLFAGSGGLGMEALSRGAEYAVFCDSSRESAAVIQANLKKLRYEDRAAVYCCDWARALDSLGTAGDGFDLIFLDPPYASGLSDRAANALYERGLLRDGFIMIIEHGPGQGPELCRGLEVYDMREYGEAVALSFVRGRSI